MSSYDSNTRIPSGVDDDLHKTADIFQIELEDLRSYISAGSYKTTYATRVHVENADRYCSTR